MTAHPPRMILFAKFDQTTEDVCGTTLRTYPKAMPGMMRRIRGWELWQLPARAAAYVLGVDALAVGVIGYGLASTEWRTSEFLTFLAFVVCGVLSIEASRRTHPSFVRENSMFKDMLSAWTLPPVLLLPPVYAALTTIPLYAFGQAWRQRQTPLKRTFNAASVGLTGFLAAVIYRLITTGSATSGLASLQEPRGAIAILVAAIVSLLLNNIIVGGIVHLVTPDLQLRKLFLDRDSITIDVAERAMGIAVAACWSIQPFLILAFFPPVLLLQRSLLHAELLQAARTDAKTLLANSVYWREIAGRAVDRAAADGQALALMLIDIDHFKRINDAHGHLVGDQVLTAVAQCLADNVRDHDVVGRFGGEEFVVLLPDTDPAVATRAAERLRKRVEALPLPYAPRGGELRVTISVGVVVLDGDARDLDTLLQRADGALYAAKEGGRNQVRSSPDAPTTPVLHGA